MSLFWKKRCNLRIRLLHVEFYCLLDSIIAHTKKLVFYVQKFGGQRFLTLLLNKSQMCCYYLKTLKILMNTQLMMCYVYVDITTCLN